MLCDVCHILSPNYSGYLKINNTYIKTVYIHQVGHCYIDSVCYADGAANPADDCLSCQAGDNPFDWTMGMYNKQAMAVV